MVTTKPQTVTAYLAERLLNDTSENRELAAHEYALMRWPRLTFRADVEDEITWETLGALTVAEADKWEAEQEDVAEFAGGWR